MNLVQENIPSFQPQFNQLSCLHKWERVSADEKKDIITLILNNIDEEANTCFSGIRKLGLLKQLNITMKGNYIFHWEAESENFQKLLQKIGEQLGKMRVLNTLNLQMSNCIYQSGFLSSLKNIPNLTSFELIHLNINQSKIPSLTESSDMNKFTNQLCDELTIVSQCHNLVVFKYNFPSCFSLKYVLNEQIKSALYQLQISQSLQHIEISNNSCDIDIDIYEEMGITFSQMNALKHLRIEISNQQKKEDFGNGLFELVKHLKNSCSISHLEIATKDDFSLFINRFSETLLELRNINNLTSLKLEISLLSEVYLNEERKLPENIGNDQNQMYAKIFEKLLSPIGNLPNLRKLSILFSGMIPFQAFSFLIHLKNLNSLEVGSINFQKLQFELFHQQNRSNINAFIKILAQLRSIHYLNIHYDQQMRQDLQCKLRALVELKMGNTENHQ